MAQLNISHNDGDIKLFASFNDLFGIACVPTALALTNLLTNEEDYSGEINAWLKQAQK